MSKRKAESGLVTEKNKTAKKSPKTLKDKILDLLAHQEVLVGLSSIKKILAEKYLVEESTANNSKLNKTLKSLLEEGRNDFEKIGGSYCIMAVSKVLHILHMKPTWRQNRRH